MGRLRTGAPVDTFPVAIQVVETVVLLVDDNDMVNFRDLVATQAVRIWLYRQRLRQANGYTGRKEHSCRIQELRARHKTSLILTSAKRVRKPHPSVEFSSSEVAAVVWWRELVAEHETENLCLVFGRDESPM